jgi:hypothetical protein
LGQHANYAPENLTTIGSLATINGKPRYYPVDRRGGYSAVEGHGSSNGNAPLPVTLRYDGAPSVITLSVWEPVKPGAAATLRIVLFNHVEGDEVSVHLNGAALKRDLTDPRWKDIRIFSPLPQPGITPGAVLKNLDQQKLARIEFGVPIERLKRGPNTLAISVNRTGSFPPAKPVQLEKIELHLK